MSGLRRLFRGSGRALAFVFAASIAWLLLDMAALLLSLGEAGGKLLRQASGRGQGRTGPPALLRRWGGGRLEGLRGARLGAAGRAGALGRAPSLELLGDARAGTPERASSLQPPEDTRAGTPGRAASPSGAVRRSGVGATAAGTEPGQKETAPAVPFVLLSKEGRGPGSPPAPHPDSHYVGNFSKSPEKREEQQLDGEKGAHPASTIPGHAAPDGQTPALGATQREAPGAGAAGQGGWEPAGSSPGTHQVLAMDATLIPRDPQAPGQFGHPVTVPEDKQQEAKSRWKEGNFNVYLSDLIPVDRAIADTRPARCSEQWVHDDLPTTSIIMCFVDEVWSTLLRSVHSVLSRSPPHLIEEVILVDDFSTKEYLKDKLDTYMLRFPKVKVLHLKQRHGLIRARLAGAEIARGTVLTFLDSHVECNIGWLEPLLERVRLNRTKVACPVIEVISDKDMSYMTVDNFQRGIFTWPMNFGWRQIPQEVIEKNKIKETDIIRCPVMAGGLFSIDKKYFFELGAYDPGLDVWGGENMEISFKVWMCGGEIEIVPCSRVGHIFRNDNPYSFPKDRVRTVERNLARVAEVWLDEYKELFYGHAYHLVLKNLDVGNLTQQIQLRKKLQCRSFRWYLENVYPDLDAPLVKASGVLCARGLVVLSVTGSYFCGHSVGVWSCLTNIRRTGTRAMSKPRTYLIRPGTFLEGLMNVALARCLTVENTTVVMEACDGNNEHQQFNYTWLRLLQHGELCVTPASTVGAVGLHRCHSRSPSLTWLHRSLAAFQPEMKDHIISEHLQQPVCLEVDPSLQSLRVSACNSTNPYQKWQFGSYYAE